MATLFDGVLFPQSLQELVKGIRAHRRDEAAYIRGKIAEITTECRSSEPHKKANGVLKLTYVSALPPAGVDVASVRRFFRASAFLSL